MPKHRYWTGLLLLARIVVHLTAAVNVSVDPSINILVTGIVASFLLFLKGHFGKIYKNWLLGSLAIACYLNIALLSFVTFFNLRSGRDQDAAAYISGLITMALMITVLTYHTFSRLISKTKLCRKMRESSLQRVWSTTGEREIEAEMTSDRFLLTTTVVDAPRKGEALTGYCELREELLETTP